MSYLLFFAIILECFVCRVLTIKLNFITWLALWFLTKPQHPLVVTLWYYIHSPQKYSFKIFIAFQGFFFAVLFENSDTGSGRSMFTNKNQRHVVSSYLNLSLHTNSLSQSAMKQVETNTHGRIMFVLWVEASYCRRSWGANDKPQREAWNWTNSVVNSFAECSMWDITYFFVIKALSSSEPRVGLRAKTHS